MSTSAERIASVVQTCHDKAARSHRPARAVAFEILSTQPGELVLQMATEMLVEAVARIERAAALKVERQAEVKPVRRPRESPATNPAWEREDREMDERHNRELIDILEQYTQEIRMKWTDELLDSSFALPDGTVVLWGDATVEQHTERKRMFLGNAHANMEGAARHDAAIRELAASRAPNLRAMVAAVA